ncbi:DUF262 domain-containing protein [Gloeocapsa sp. PCC 73106]|uniref:DUF262 domain-containing protein n=1 Tax=Gloeocapsa sp. PCC 73106 TaxID=102232 RepID=UPI0002AC42A2|nr:DUF262 domain-containing protein [Gloeocapsa sp. PCC 73106]ELR98938.1 hypothetical protein GLO73106DRAFT_00027810 [Gloeocapsa sp. PCC 73106]
MKASETKMQEIIEGTKQYLVPLFQRAYSWKKSEWQLLWDDIVELYNATNPRPHFMGSIVTMPTTSLPEGVTKYLLIDGQQRLTTVFILLSSLRDLAKQIKEEELAEEINNTMLINPFKKGLDKYKLHPTQVDRQIFYTIIDNQKNQDKNSLTECYLFFNKAISRSRLELTKLKQIISNSFSLVSVVLGIDDDPYLVFESLNAKGRPLTQSDLIRNNMFMRINTNDQESIYAQYWQPMENLLGEDLTEFIRYYLTKSGKQVRKNEIYFEIKDRLNVQEALACLQDLYNFAQYYAKLVNPILEKQENVRRYLYRLNRLEVLTIYPFVLNCYDDWTHNKITENDFIEILKILENFILRRFICNVPTVGLNEIFAGLYSQVTKDTALGSVAFIDRLKLNLQSKNYPKDLEFKEKLTEVKLYGGNRSAKAKLILESIEDYFNHKEKINVDDLSIEHIMPRTLNKWWQEHLGNEWQVVHELFLDSLGNLTLTGYNSELSNDEFFKKCDRLKKSNLELNKYFANQQSWRREELEARGEYLANIAVKIWGYFGDEQASSPESNSLKGKSPKSLTIYGERYTVKTWRDVLEITLNQIADSDPNKFQEITEKFPRFVGWDAKDFRHTRTLKNRAFIEVHLSAKDIHRFCLRALEISDLSLEDWQIETI